MNKYLEQLVDLAQIDKEIDGFGPRLEKVERVLRATKDEQAGITEQISNIDEAVSELKSQKSQTNAHIAEFSAKIKDVSKKSSAAKTEKEIKALQLEDGLAREQLEAANEEIERLEKIIASKNDLKAELEAKGAEVAANLEKIEADIAQEVGAIEKERAEIYAKKEKLIGDMNQKILTFYEKIRKWAHNTAVVPVKKQACYGCFMQINDKTYSAVIKGEDVVTCPHCGRILYKETAE
ncbi:MULTISPECIES: zinc ribbon domain-containing protein [unclassified Campylobacter]|uniref:zinc ribbon domain-containing protein n=1 Tax=unclassified Campylobacter TaxID=2593542 RepID=UPI001473BAE3|nr:MULTISPECIES: zinc ribbon domain-containing protein [unclassified Campylobacter]